jgi:hypothetical protein
MYSYLRSICLVSLISLDLIIVVKGITSMLGGSIVNISWRILTLQMEETASSFWGQLKIIWINSRVQPTRDGPLASGLLRNFAMNLWLGRKFWVNESGYEIWHVGYKSLCRAGSLRTVSKELFKYKFDLVAGQEGGGIEPLGDCTLLYEKWNENHDLGTAILCVRELYQQLRV